MAADILINVEKSKLSGLLQIFHKLLQNSFFTCAYCFWESLISYKFRNKDESIKINFLSGTVVNETSQYEGIIPLLDVLHYSIVLHMSCLI